MLRWIQRVHPSFPDLVSLVCFSLPVSVPLRGLQPIPRVDRTWHLEKRVHFYALP